MMLSILVLITWFCSLYLTYQVNLKQLTIIDTTWKNIFQQFLAVGIIIPLIEESLFRHTVVYYSSHLSYHQYLNAFLFGLLHIPNYTLFGKKIVFFQFINTTIAGYYFVNLNNFTSAFLAHSFYNSSVLTIAFLYLLFTKKKDGNKPMTLTELVKSNINSNKNKVPFYIKTPYLRRSKSTGDLITTEVTSSYLTSYLLDKEKNEELINSLTKLENYTNPYRRLLNKKTTTEQQPLLFTSD